MRLYLYYKMYYKILKKARKKWKKYVFFAMKCSIMN